MVARWLAIAYASTALGSGAAIGDNLVWLLLLLLAIVRLLVETYRTSKDRATNA